MDKMMQDFALPAPNWQESLPEVVRSLLGPRQ